MEKIKLFNEELIVKDYLCSNSNKYPEYHQCLNYSHAEDVELCGIYLGDIYERN